MKTNILFVEDSGIILLEYKKMFVTSKNMHTYVVNSVGNAMAIVQEKKIELVSVGNVIDSEKWTNYFHFDYLTMPILIPATVGKKIKYFFNTGLFAGYLIKETEIFGAIKYFPKTTTNNTDNFKRFDFGLTAGLGLTIPIKDTFSISCEIRNNLGTYNISALPVYNNETIKTNSTNLLIGFAYKLGTRQTETK